MKIKYFISGISLVFAVFFFSACSDRAFEEVKEVTEVLPENVNEVEVLLDFYEKSGNIINQKKIPTLVKAGEVYQNLDHYHLIDIRKPDIYAQGHIKGAVNVNPASLINYMKNDITAAVYDKIVFIDNDGSKSSYVTMLFRLLGYGNVYALKWGMSSIDKNVLERYWAKGVSSKYVAQLETKGHPKGKKTGTYPQIHTGKKIAYNILEARARQIIEKPDFVISADEVFQNPGKYYVINYWPMNHYILGHIPGAIQYTPKKSLTRDKYLSTLPVDKPIAVYCYTGHHAAFVVAYLRTLGYDAYSVGYGANGFMYSVLKNKGIGKYFDKAKFFEPRELVTGSKPEPEKSKAGTK